MVDTSCYLHSRIVPDLARLTAEILRVEAENSQPTTKTTDNKLHHHNNGGKPETNPEATRLAKEISQKTTEATGHNDGNSEAARFANEISQKTTEANQLTTENSWLTTELERLIETEVRLDIEAVHLNDTVVRLTADLDRVTKERDDCRRNCDDYKMQLAGLMDKARQVEGFLAIAHQQTSETLKDIVKVRGQGVNNWRLAHVENHSTKVLESIASATGTMRLMQ